MNTDITFNHILGPVITKTKSFPLMYYWCHLCTFNTFVECHMSQLHKGLFIMTVFQCYLNVNNGQYKILKWCKIWFPDCLLWTRLWKRGLEEAITGSTGYTLGGTYTAYTPISLTACLDCGTRLEYWGESCITHYITQNSSGFKPETQKVWGNSSTSVSWIKSTCTQETSFPLIF